jgi:hypothetical protein
MCPSYVCALDERLFRYQVRKDAWKEEKQTFKNRYKWSANSSLYEIDINEDSYPEFLQSVKRDGEDWFLIRNMEKKTIFKTKLPVMGYGSYLYKVYYSKLEANVWLLILFHYQGMIQFQNFHGQSRIYFLIFEGIDYKNIYFKEGPIIGEERKLFPHWYFKRNYEVSVRDIDGDGRKDIDIAYKDSHYFYFYQKRGLWVEK